MLDEPKKNAEKLQKYVSAMISSPEDLQMLAIELAGAVGHRWVGIRFYVALVAEPTT